MENNNPPFEVGQRIVCIKESDLLTKDHIYRVVAIRKSCGCFWDVSVGISDDGKYCYCPKCDKRDIPTHGYRWHNHLRFAPYNPYSNSLSKELAQEALIERIETDVPEKVIPSSTVIN